MPGLRLVVFDLEGTVFKKAYKAHEGEEFDSAWGALCSYLGRDAAIEDEVNRKRYYNESSHYSYLNWVLDTLAIYKKHGLTENSFNDMIESVDYFSGVAEVFSELNSRGITTAVVSGGLKALADRVCRDFKVVHAFTAAELFWCCLGKLNHWNIMPTDFYHKKTILNMLLTELGIDKAQTAFVGDGINDIHIASSAGKSVAFNSKYEELDRVSTYVVKQKPGMENLSKILELIL
jgi:phosphoserine phosphatase